MKEPYSYRSDCSRLPCEPPGFFDGCQTIANPDISDQLFRSCTGAAANYRAACRGRSRRDFTAKLGVAHEESDETQFWLIVIKRGEYSSGIELEYLLHESRELLDILTASVKTANLHREPFN